MLSQSIRSQRDSLGITLGRSSCGSARSRPRGWHMSALWQHSPQHNTGLRLLTSLRSIIRKTWRLFVPPKKRLAGPNFLSDKPFYTVVWMDAAHAGASPALLYRGDDVSPDGAEDFRAAGVRSCCPRPFWLSRARRKRVLLATT